MLYREDSLYPDQVDPLIYFQDTNLDTQEIMEAYNSLIEAGEYDAANEYVESQKRIYGYWAHYLNAIENRIYALQNYTSNDTATVLITELTSYETDEPDVFVPTHEDLEVYTHEELELAGVIQGYCWPDEPIWITYEE